MKGFLNFIREQGVVGLAIGFIVGGAISKLVKAFADDIVSPITSLAIGSPDSLRSASSTVMGASFLWGDLLATTVDFIIVALVVYYGFKILRIDKLDKKKD